MELIVFVTTTKLAFSIQQMHYLLIANFLKLKCYNTLFLNLVGVF